MLSGGCSRGNRLAARILIGARAATLGAIDYLAARWKESNVKSNDVDATVTRLMKSANVTGVGSSVFHNRMTSYLKTYGQSDRAVANCSLTRKPSLIP